MPKNDTSETAPRQPYQVVRPIAHGIRINDKKSERSVYRQGETVQLTDAEAEELLAIGSVAPMPTAKAGK